MRWWNELSPALRKTYLEEATNALGYDASPDEAWEHWKEASDREIEEQRKISHPKTFSAEEKAARLAVGIPIGHLPIGKGQGRRRSQAV